jgi:tellurite resistance protein
MNDQDKRAIMTVALCAAFADGSNDERERKALQQVADALGRDGGIDFPALYRDVL